MKRTLIFLLLLPCLLCATAQHYRKPAVKTKKPAATVVSPGLKLFKQMLESTAKVMFIDSVVVDKGNFLANVPLSSEAGSLWIVNPKVAFKDRHAAFQNEFGDRRIVTQGDSTNTALYTQTLLGNEWGKPAKIKDIGEAEFTMQNYPFLAADGVTLFFSAGGDESMGGRDIFMTTFDSDNAKWYKPQNYGLPFNSTANDYLLAIDDLDTLGWLVTDRRQPEGKVCVYTFVPTETRLNFDDDDLDDDELFSYARILSIKDTWRFGNRDAAIKRRDAMLARIASKGKAKESMSFVVDDNTVITSPLQFRRDESRRLYGQIVELRQMVKETEGYLDKARQAYHEGNHLLSRDILRAERDLQQQKADIYTLEKHIRALETSSSDQN